MSCPSYSAGSRAGLVDSDSLCAPGDNLLAALRRADGGRPQLTDGGHGKQRRGQRTRRACAAAGTGQLPCGARSVGGGWAGVSPVLGACVPCRTEKYQFYTEKCQFLRLLEGLDIMI